MSDSRGSEKTSFGPHLPSPSEFISLCERLCDGTATPVETSTIEHTLKSSSEAREFYQEFLQVHAALWMAANGQDAELFAELSADTTADAQAETSQREAAMQSSIVNADRWNAPAMLTSVLGSLLTSARHHPLLHTLGIACGILLAVFFGGLLTDVKKAHELAESVPSTILVARLQESHHCKWGSTSAPLVESEELHSGQCLELIAGTAKLVFHGGAIVIVESPALFELLTDKSMRLEYGTVAAHVTGPKKEFVVVSPDASVVDLGTNFGVHRDRGGSTEVEVFEGAVEFYAEGGSKDACVLGVGGSARVQQGDLRPEVAMVAAHEDRFADLLEYLWEEMSQNSDAVDRDDKSVVECHFNDGPVPGAVDTFYGATRGAGWLTPWIAAGNPTGDILRDSPLSGADNPYLRVRFFRSYERAIARQYGERNGFNPSKPHVISWDWRFDGNPDHFGADFTDRIYFYSNPYFRRNSWTTNGWLIGVAGGDEKQRKRKVFPKRWYVFDGKEGARGKEFDRRNMVDTGMEFKPGVTYRFAVVVYPELCQYDVAIRDDETTFSKVGLNFRDRTPRPTNVIHFGASANDATDDLSFSLDSIRIEPLNNLAAANPLNAQDQETSLGSASSLTGSSSDPESLNSLQAQPEISLEN